MPAGASDRTPPDDGRPAAGSSPRDAGPRRLLGELVGARHPSAPVPLEPLPAIEPVPVPDTSVGARGRAARRRRAALEDAARRNARLASTARDLLLLERRRLEAERSARHRAEDEMAALQRAVAELRAAARRRPAPSGTTGARPAPGPRVGDLVEELDRLRRALDDQAALTTEYADRLRSEHRVREVARAALERAEAARRQAERRLEAAAAVVRGRAETELAEIAAAEEAARRAGEERDALAARLAALTGGDAQLRDLEGRNAALLARVDELEAAVGRSRRPEVSPRRPGPRGE